MIAPSLTMSVEELELFDEFLSTRFGMSFPHHRKEILESRLVPRLRELKLPTFMDYYYTLQFAENGTGRGELDALVRAITNNETYFFRETHQFPALVEAVAARRREAPSASDPFRILSAGCSSGEEPFTLGIHLKENGHRYWGQQFAIEAFDLDPDRIAIAKGAEYGQSSLRALSPEQIERYFQKLGNDRWSLRQIYRSDINFRIGNLLDAVSYGLPGRFDVIFCRNVLIYFAEDPLLRTIRNFQRSLRPGGLLFLGHSESIIGLVPQLEAVRVEGCIAYRKVA